jgi:hypothetical protein
MARRSMARAMSAELDPRDGSVERRSLSRLELALVVEGVTATDQHHGVAEEVDSLVTDDVGLRYPTTPPPTRPPPDDRFHP